MIEKTLRLYVRPNPKNDQGFDYYVDDYEFSNHWPRDGDIRLDDVSVSFYEPRGMTPEKLRLKAIETLKEAQERIRAEAHKQVEELQEQINKLLLLTDQRAPRSDTTRFFDG